MMDLQEQLLQALQRQHPQEVRDALVAGADPFYKYPHVNLDGSYDRHNLSALDIAFILDDEASALVLIESMGSRLREFQDTGENFVENFAAMGMQNAVEAMARHGANLDHTNSDDHTGIETAIANQHYDTAISLLRHGASPNATLDNMLLRMDQAIPDDDWERCLVALLDHGLDMNAEIDDVPVIEEVSDPVKTRCYEFDGQIEEMLLENPKGSPAELFAHGKASTAMLGILGTGRLEELFTPARWEGHEEEALKLHDDLKYAVPAYYKSVVANLDLSTLRNHVLSNTPDLTAVERYVRPPNEKKGRAS